MAEGERRHHDGFDALRIVAAVAVIYWHAFALTGQRSPQVPLLHSAGADVGSLAVGAFFAMSGYLVAASWARRPDAAAFLAARARRILPGLVVCVMLAGFVLAPIAGGDAFDLRSSLSYIARSGSLFRVDYDLPGVFESNPYPGVVNGSLWSLPYEVAAYLIVLGVGLVAAARRTLAVVGLAGAAVATHAAVVDASLSVDRIDRLLGWWGLDLHNLAAVLVFFVIGMVAFTSADRWMHHRATVALVAAAAMVGGSWIGLLTVQSTAVAALVLVVGTCSSETVRRLRKVGDPSYGAYIYAFPIQQALAAAGVRSVSTMCILAIPLSLAAGYTSWHVVEKWSVRRTRLSGGSGEHHSEQADVAGLGVVGV